MSDLVEAYGSRERMVARERKEMLTGEAEGHPRQRPLPLPLAVLVTPALLLVDYELS